MFSYQAVVRGDDGGVLQSASLQVRLSLLQGSDAGTVVWSETHSVTTNAQGLFTVEAGSEKPLTVDWSAGPWWLKVEVDLNDGNGFREMGSSQLLSVPYALYGEDADADPGNEIQDLQLEGNILTITRNGSATQIDLSPYLDNPGWSRAGDTLSYTGSVTVGTTHAGGTKLAVQGDDLNGDAPLFVVRRKDGQPVFVVYNDGVHIYVNDTADTKGPRRSGFAIGGYGMTKGEAAEYFRVTPDSTRVYVREPSSKGPRRSGFAIGGMDYSKGTVKEYFNVSGSAAVEVVDPSEPRLLWYPRKEAFLAGRVLVESPDSVGTNAMATGFESKAIGNYSQALGYRARATGDYAMAIGKNTQADGNSSFAFGDGTVASGSGSLALGDRARATTTNSFAFGSSSNAQNTGALALGYQTDATGYYATAMGYRSIASGSSATAMGNGSQALSNYSLAAGFNAKTDMATGYKNYPTAKEGYGAIALGYQTVARGRGSVALGYKCETYAPYSAAIGGYMSYAYEWGSTALGDNCKAYAKHSFTTGYHSETHGHASIAMGEVSKTYGSRSTAIGSGCNTYGNYSSAIGKGLATNSLFMAALGAFNDTVPGADRINWVATDPIFVIGNGTYYSSRSNAMLVKKNGEVYFPDVYGDAITGSYRDLYIGSDGKIGYVSSSRRYKENIRDMEDVSWLYRLRPVNFVYKEDPSHTWQYGLIAEEVEKVNPLLVSYDAQGRPETVTYGMLVTPLLKALQEQQKEIERLKKENADLAVLKKELKKVKEENARIAALENEVAELKQLLGAMTRK